MLGFHEKRKVSHIFFSKGSMFVLFVATVLMAYATMNAYERREEAYARHKVTADELSRLEARASGLSEDIARLEDPRGIEEELRRRYDVGKEGEEVIVFIETEDTPEPDVVLQQRPVTFVERIKAFFSGE